MKAAAAWVMPENGLFLEPPGAVRAAKKKRGPPEEDRPRAPDAGSWARSFAPRDRFIDDFTNDIATSTTELRCLRASSMKSLMKEMWQDLADRQDAFFERVLSNQANLLARVNALRDQAAQGVLVPVLPDDCPTLPASSPAEMKALNTYLKKKEKLDQMATYFRQNGGKDHKAAARAVLGLLISNSVAKCCSWAGSHGAKEALLDYGNILELVLAALKPKFNMADRSTVAAVAKRWLSSSGDRDGGRANRRRPNNCQKTREK
ncbi:uncharacterized protein ISCGN_031530 [Ixodes scapularis]